MQQKKQNVWQAFLARRLHYGRQALPTFRSKKPFFQSVSRSFHPRGGNITFGNDKTQCKKRAIFFPALCSVGRNPALPRHPKLHCTPMKIVECMVHFTGSQWIQAADLALNSSVRTIANNFCDPNKWHPNSYNVIRIWSGALTLQREVQTQTVKATRIREEVIPQYHDI